MSNKFLVTLDGTVFGTDYPTPSPLRTHLIQGHYAIGGFESYATARDVTYRLNLLITPCELKHPSARDALVRFGIDHSVADAALTYALRYHKLDRTIHVSSRTHDYAAKSERPVPPLSSADLREAYNLLALINGDGGHYTHFAGLESSAKNAQAIFNQLQGTIAACEKCSVAYHTIPATITVDNHAEN